MCVRASGFASACVCVLKCTGMRGKYMGRDVAWSMGISSDPTRSHFASDSAMDACVHSCSCRGPCCVCGIAEARHFFIFAFMWERSAGMASTSHAGMCACDIVCKLPCVLAT